MLLWLETPTAANALHVGRDGILLLQVNGRDDNNRHYAKHSFLSYNYTTSGTLMVEARELQIDVLGNEEFPFTDAGRHDFLAAWLLHMATKSGASSQTGPLPILWLFQSVHARRLSIVVLR